MKSPTTVTEACHFVAEQIAKVAKESNQDVAAEVHIEGDDWPYDSVVILQHRFRNGGLHDTGYCISPTIEQEARAIGGEQHDVLYYYVQHEEMVHGVRYYPDGSGEPDSSDVVDDLKTSSPFIAATKVVLLNIELNINHMFEAEGEAEMAEMADEMVDFG